MPRELTEHEWAAQFEDLVRLYRWSYLHLRPARTMKGWRTAVAGDLGAGWPDYVLVRERVLFVELKAGRGRLSAEQIAVREALRDAEAEFYCWRPQDFDEAVQVLGTAT